MVRKTFSVAVVASTAVLSKLAHALPADPAANAISTASAKPKTISLVMVVVDDSVSNAFNETVSIIENAVSEKYLAGMATIKSAKGGKAVSSYDVLTREGWMLQNSNEPMLNKIAPLSVMISKRSDPPACGKPDCGSKAPPCGYPAPPGGYPAPPGGYPPPPGGWDSIAYPPETGGNLCIYPIPPCPAPPGGPPPPPPPPGGCPAPPGTGENKCSCPAPPPKKDCHAVATRGEQRPKPCKDLSNVDWSNVDWTKVDWSQVDWSKVDYSKIDWSKVDFSKVDFKKDSD